MSLLLNAPCTIDMAVSTVHHGGMTTHLQQFMRRKKWSYAVMARNIDVAITQAAPAIAHRPVSRSLVCKWAHGKMTPDLRYALAISKVCGRSVPLSSLVVWR